MHATALWDDTYVKIKTIGGFEKKIIHLHNVCDPVGKISDQCECTTISCHSSDRKSVV